MDRSSRRLRLVGLLLIFAIAAAAATASAVDLPADASGDWLARAQREIATREYRASRTDAGLQAPNRAHDLRTYFAPDGIRVHDRTDPDAALVSMTLAGVGRGANLAPIGAGEVVSDGARVEIRRPDWDGGPGATTPDPQCAGTPWKDKEGANSGGCGLGAELALILSLVALARREHVLS